MTVSALATARPLLLLTVCLLRIAWALPLSGSIHSLTETSLNYLVPLNEAQITTYSRGSSNQIVSTSVLDWGRILVFDGHDPETKRTLFLTPHSVEVYREQAATSQIVFVETIPLLSSGCLPRYLLKSSLVDSGEFFVSYHGNCHPTRFLYYQQTITADTYPLPLPGPNIVVATKTENDLYIYIDKDKLKLKSVDDEVNGKTVNINSIGDCVTGNTLYTLPPRDQNHAVFAMNCSTSSSTVKVYHLQWPYRFRGGDPIWNEIAPGVPVGGEQGQYFAVGQGNEVTVYSSSELEGGVPGSTLLSGPIRQITFHQLLSSPWLSVVIENSNVFLINVAQFITTRGVEGVFELADTNIGVCDPICLPQMVIGDQLVVSNYNQDQLKYGYVGFSLADSSNPQEVFRRRGIPGRPLYSVFVEGPTSLSTPPPTSETTPTSPPELTSTPSLPSVLMFDIVRDVVVPIAVVFLLILAVLVLAVGTITIYRWYRRWPSGRSKKRSDIEAIELTSMGEFNPILTANGKTDVNKENNTVEHTSSVTDEETPVETTPTDQSPDKELPTDQSRDKELPTDQSRDKEPPTDQSPDKELPTDQSPDKELPTDQSRDKELPTGQPPVEETATDQPPIQATLEKSEESEGPERPSSFVVAP